jgi:hypothetical protein
LKLMLVGVLAAEMVVVVVPYESMVESVAPAVSEDSSLANIA